MDKFLYKKSTKRRQTFNKGSKKKTVPSAAAASSSVATLYHKYHPHPFHHLHPHLLAHAGPDASSQATRLLGTILSLPWQHHFRDGGGFQAVADTLVQASIPLAAMANPRASLTFLRLTRQNRRLQYGTEAAQFMDVFLPQTTEPTQYKGMVFFVHGGAWGSGKPWFYRLCALPFLQRGLAVAIVGNRVYPRGVVQDQVNDLEAGFAKLMEVYPDWCCNCKDSTKDTKHLGSIVMGHSSGAHIGLLWLVQRMKEQMMEQSSFINSNQPIITTFVGISGPYNVNHHFDYEAARGVEEISPLKPVNGLTRENLKQNSPAYRLQQALKDLAHEGHIQDLFPKQCLLIHGIEDDTVPFVATAEAACVLRRCGLLQCQEIYVPETGHQEAVVHLMLGGRTKDAIVDWLISAGNNNSSSVSYQSKL